jgi:hypothetical protein
MPPGVSGTPTSDMGTVLISYQLSDAETAPGYGPLLDAIKGMGPWARVLSSVWLVDTDLTPTTVRDNLTATLVSDNDRLFVIDVSKNSAAWRSLPAEVGTWIQEHL